eukprot:UN00186
MKLKVILVSVNLGFDGDMCENDINECEFIDCNNNGTCVDYVMGYHCICNDGFEGRDCEATVGLLMKSSREDR